MLVDSHCHLDFDVFDEDRQETIQRARDAGVATMVTICTRVTRFEEIRAIAETDENIWCSVGIHPHQAEEEPVVTVEDLVSRAAHPKVIGIGETGLDYYYDNSPRGLQETSFRTHIAASRETGLPLIVHTRDADEDMADILEDEMGKGAFPGVLHCFFFRSPVGGKGARYRVLYLAIRHRDIQERSGPSRYRQRCAG